MKYLIIGFYSFMALIALGQDSDTFKRIKGQYRDDIGVYTERSKYLTISAKGDSLVSSATVKETILFLKDQQKYSTDWRIYGSYFQEIEGIEAKAILSENGRTREVKMLSPSKRREDDNSVFFDDSYFYQVSFPLCKEGSQESWSYSEKYRDPKFLPAFNFYGNLPMDRSVFTIKMSKGIDLAWKVYNDPTNTIDFRQYDKGANTYFEWSVKNFKSPQYEEDCPKISYYAPQVVYYVKSYLLKDGTRKNVLSGLDDLYHDYLTTVSKLNEEPSPALDSLVQKLIGPADDELTKVRKIYYWVQDHIRYIAFEDGMRGLIPHKPNYIFQKRYGDCKDMASLIVGLLKVAGVKAYYTWIGTRDIPYRYTTLPTPLVDNHMIATYIDENKNYYFLDATGNYTRLGLPSSMIQEKESFIALPTKYEIREVPKVPAELNCKRDSVVVRIENKFLVGKGTACLSGYEKVNTSYSLDRAKQESQKDNVVQCVKKGNNKFYLDSFVISNLHEKDLPLKIEYDFRIGDYINEFGGELYVNLNLSKVLYNSMIPADRKLPQENEYQVRYDEIYLLDFPAGYDLSYLPSNSSFHSKSLDFEINYSVKDRTILVKSVVTKHVLMLTPDLFADWNEAITKLSKSYRETVIFKTSKK